MVQSLILYLLLLHYRRLCQDFDNSKTARDFSFTSPTKKSLSKENKISDFIGLDRFRKARQ